MATKRKDKISRLKLARGTELVHEHTDVLTSAKRTLNMDLPGTNPQNSEVPNSTFSLNLNIPWIDSKYFYDNNDGKDPFYISFCLPPLQEHFQTHALKKSTGVDVPVPVLEGISFSFDQKGTRAPTVSPWYGTSKIDSSDDETLFYQYTGGNEASAGVPTGHAHFEPNPFEGFLAFNRTPGLDFKISIYSKQQTFFDKDVYDPSLARKYSVTSHIEDEVMSLDIPPEAFTGGLNPYAVDGLNKAFDPYKTYVLALHAPKLHDGRLIGASDPDKPPAVDISGVSYRHNEHLALVSVWFCLRFKMERVTRDLHTGTVGSTTPTVQNFPSAAATRTGPTITITHPTEGDPITADGAKGISTNLQALDDVVRGKLRGGYQDISAAAYPTQTVKYDAGYEIIAVPLMQGFPNNRLAVAQDWHNLPYTADGGSGVADSPYIDRRIIPIPSGFTLHHVVALLNFTSDKVLAAAPSTTTVRPPLTDYSSASQASYKAVYAKATIPRNAAGAAGGRFLYQIGVGLVTGEQSDDFAYQQLAYVSYDPSLEADTDGSGTQFNSPFLIDSIGMGLGAVDNKPLSQKYPWEQLLVSVPLVRGAMSYDAGVGYWKWHSSSPTSGIAGAGTQGMPIFIGEGAAGMGTAFPKGTGTVRTQVGDTADSPAYADSAVRGAEQYIEVRMAVAPTSSIMRAATTYDGGDYATTDIAVGYGGNFVYLIGKKHLRG